MRETSLPEIVKGITADREYRQALTARIAARALDPGVLDQLIAYARSRQTTLGHAMARQILTDAGVSWEAL